VTGKVTWFEDLKDAYMDAMDDDKMKLDVGILHQFGFKWTPKERANVCMSCKQEAKKGCCPAYSADNRRKKSVIHNMVLTKFSG
jgi:hypothetical protein